MIRLFAALAVPGPIAEGLAHRFHGLPGARWRPLESLHITLRFFGNISENKADDLDAELLAVRARSFDLALAGVGSFGEGPRIDAVWAGIEASEPLGRLAARCEAAARRAGLKAETRAYHPHVTLAYLDRPEQARVVAWVQSHNLLKSPAFRANSFGLYSSWRTEEGSRYQLQRTYPLG